MIKTRMVLWFALMLGSAAPTPLVAQEISQADRLDIAARVAAFNDVMAANRVSEIVAFLPPRLLSMIAAKAGVSEEQIRVEMPRQMAAAFETVKLISFDMNMESATVGTTTGQGRGYMLMPTETVMELPEGQRLRSKSTTLALREGPQWYLVRVDSAAQILMLRDAYPEFAGVDFPSSSMSAAN